MQGEWRAATLDETGARRDDDAAFGTHAPNRLQRLLISLSRASFLKRGLFRKPVTDLIFRLGSHPCLDVHFRGCAYRLHGDHNLIEYGLLLKPDYNGEDIDFLTAEAPPGAVFVDIGCNIGLYTLPLAKAAGPNGKVVAIDANPLMARRVDWNGSASGLANLRIFACAVGDHDGRASLAIRKEDLAIATVRDDADGDIPMRRLDALLDEAAIDSIYGLKIDIEGHEDSALAPFIDAAPETLLPARIVIEHPSPDTDYPACAAVFAKRGYRLAGRTRNNSLYRRD